MKRNDSKLTPKGYKSFHLFTVKDENKITEVNILKKKDFFDKYFLKVSLILFFLITPNGFLYVALSAFADNEHVQNVMHSFF